MSDDFTNFWKKTASVFKDEPNVIGYELINEPWVGNLWTDPILIMGRGHTAKLLQPFYQKIHEGIRSVDDEKIIFFEP